jgi:hypothetical protein
MNTENNIVYLTFDDLNGSEEIDNNETNTNEVPDLEFSDSDEEEDLENSNHKEEENLKFYNHLLYSDNKYDVYYDDYGYEKPNEDELCAEYEYYLDIKIEIFNELVIKNYYKKNVLKELRYKKFHKKYLRKYVFQEYYAWFLHFDRLHLLKNYYEEFENDNFILNI